MFNRELHFGPKMKHTLFFELENMPNVLVFSPILQVTWCWMAAARWPWQPPACSSSPGCLSSTCCPGANSMGSSHCPRTLLTLHLCCSSSSFLMCCRKPSPSRCARTRNTACYNIVQLFNTLALKMKDVWWCFTDPKEHQSQSEDFRIIQDRGNNQLLMLKFF